MSDNKILKVHLDAGHYGTKYNRSTTNSKYYESAMTWKLTNYIKEELENKGALVTLSRTNIDDNPSLYNRGYGAKGCDLFLSIHSNACGTESVDYPVVFRGYNKPEAQELSQQLANTIHEVMGTKQAGRVSIKQSTKTGKEYYGVLRGASEAGLVYFYIVEHSFHTNTKSTEWLLDDNNLRLLAKKEVEVILQYFNVKTEDKVESAESVQLTDEQIIWNTLLKHFNNPYGVAGLMGNLRAESNLRPNNLQNTYSKKFNLTDEEYTEQVDNNQYNNFIHDKAGYGLAQWTYWSRKQNLYNFLKSKNLSIGDLNGQLLFLIEELKKYVPVYKVLQSATSVKEASDIILTQYEKPADQSDKVKDKRCSYGLEYFNKYNKISVSSFRVKIKADSLNIRTGPSTDNKIVGAIKDHGVYTIVDVNPANTWGLLLSYQKNRDGWISIRPQYVERR